MASTTTLKTKFQKNVLEKYFSGSSMDYHQVFKIILPVLIDQFFITFLGLVNTSMISNSGMAAVSAVGMVDSLNIFLINIFVAVSIGGTVVVAQYKGVENKEMISKAASNSIVTVFLISILISGLIVILHNPILNFLFGNAEKDVLDCARTYLIGSAISYIGIAISEAVCGALRGIGETKSSLLISILMNVAYVLLNFLFINTLHMGILGMSISIILARAFGAVFSIFYMLKHKELLDFKLLNLLHISFSMVKKIFYVGIPFAAEQLFFNGGKILTQTFIVSLGTNSLSVNTINGSIAGLLQVPASSLSIAVVTVVGQCIGRHDVTDAKKFIKSFLWLGSISFVFTSIILFSLFNPIISLFNPPKELINLIFEILICCALFEIPLWSISFVLPSALRAAGDSKFTSMVSMLSMWFFRVVLGYILGIILKFGIFGIWLAMDIEWSVRGLVFILRFRGKKWYAHNLIG